MRFHHYRERVFNVYWTFFLVIVLGWIFLFTAEFVREFGFPWLYDLVTKVIPAIVVAYIKDPWLIVAFIVGSLFLWSFPWGSIFGGGESSPNYEPDNFRRGRRINGPETADYAAYQEMMRQRKKRRNQRRIHDA